MPSVTVVYGVLLSVLGLVAYFSTGRVSVTALIPTFFGVPVIIVGVLAHKQHLLKHMMHVAALLAVLGFAGSVPGLMKLPKLLGDGELERPSAVVVQSIMALLSLVFVLLCIRSFMEARRARKAGSP